MTSLEISVFFVSPWKHRSLIYSALSLEFLPCHVQTVCGHAETGQILKVTVKTHCKLDTDFTSILLLTKRNSYFSFKNQCFTKSTV